MPRKTEAGLVHGIRIGEVGAVVFDLGGVFLEGTVENARRFGENVGLTPEAWRQIYRDLFLDAGPWDEVERGEMTLDAFARILMRRTAEHGVEIGLERARNFMGNPADSLLMRLRPEIVNACKAVRRRMPTALLTNNIAEWRHGWRTRLDIDGLFEHVIDSSEVGMRKPEPRIYRLTEERLGMGGGDLLFIDDFGVNLKAARELGWQTLKYDDTQKVLQVLDAVAEINPGTREPSS